MRTESMIEIDAPAHVVWDVYSDVERWSDWTASVERIATMDGPALEIGNRFEIKQPRLPKLVWEVTAVEPGTSWTWRQRSFGGTAVAWHEVVAKGEGRTLVRGGIDQRGPVGVVVGLLTHRLTKRYLDLESQGLKATSERLAGRDVSSG